MENNGESLVCGDCGNGFLFTAAEAEFYRSRNLQVPPKRCKDCRRARKMQNDRGDRGGFSAPREGGFGGQRDRGGFSAPREGGFGGQRDRGGFSAPREGGFGGQRDRGGFSAPREGGFGGQRDRGGFSPPREGGFDDGPRFNGPRGYGGGDLPRAGGGFRGGERPRFEPAPESRFSRWDAAPAEGAGESERSFSAPRVPRERPRYDITCMACGSAASIPFKPVAGREIFCPSCYRAKKGGNAQD